MLAHRDHHRYVKWSLDNVASNILRPAFPDRDVLVVRPSRFERATFSCFDNFVQSNWNGAPTHLRDPGHLESLSQLSGILASLQDLLCSEGSTESGDLRGSRKILIGFSKGVVVLNQILHEIAALRDLTSDQAQLSDEQEKLLEFSRTISAMSWLDGGHNGGKDTWLTDHKILQAVVSHGMKVDVRVTPYQVSDDRRPWIGKEEKKFSSFLFREMGKDRFRRQMFYAEEEPCLDNHFRILETFEAGDKFLS